MIISLFGVVETPGGQRATKTPAIDGARSSGSNGDGRYHEPLLSLSLPNCEILSALHHHVLAVFIKYAPSIKATCYGIRTGLPGRHPLTYQDAPSVVVL